MMADPSSNLHEYSVSELSGALKSTIEDSFSLVRVRGELGRVTRAASGHMYMDLKDDRAVISGVVWKGNAARLKIEPEQGMEVIATGRMTTFPGQSRYQIVIDRLEPAGAGALMALFEARKKQLASEGLFAPERKKEIPFLPSVIGVVTSPSGAVIRDILHRLRERMPSHVIVWPTLVQGKGAEKQIVKAIEGFNAIPSDGQGLVPRPDLLIVARGGGSIEDLWCFNEESVARAAAASDIPLISAVGHETDTTLIDYVSDRRAPTPTAAAEIATPVRSELVSELLNKERRLVDAQSRQLTEYRASLRAAERGLGRPEDMLGASAQRLDRASDRLMAAMRARIQHAQAGFSRSAGQLSPAILSTGFEARHGRVTRAADKLMAGITRNLERRKDRVHSIRMSTQGISRQIDTEKNRLDGLSMRLVSYVDQAQTRRTDKLQNLDKLLSTLSHKNVLARGFALVRDKSGKLARSASPLTTGATGSVELQDGTRNITFGDMVGAAETSKKATGKKKSQKKLPPSQTTLFD